MKLTTKDLHEKLDQQIRLIKFSLKAFDEGFYDAALYLSTHLYNLLYDGKNTKKGQGSLFGHLKIKNTLKYYDSSSDIQPCAGIHSTYNGLINIFLGEKIGIKPIPILDGNPNAKYVNFDAWRNGIIFIDEYNNKFSREYIIKLVRCKDGGSHIDGILPEEAFKLMKTEGLGMNIKEGNERKRIRQLEYFAIRQMTHEILKTLDNQYISESVVEKEPGYAAGGNTHLLSYPNQKVHAVFSVGKHEYSIPFF